jgi:hypothetical protein
MSSGCGYAGFNLIRRIRTTMAWLETKDDKEISYKGLEKRNRERGKRREKGRE